ncbi:hypothetical protein GUJ93_ZPchr0002g24512 [Zizania palustris]|uniref:Uncharacterized protein n=1 Tax=Zizania palustris TaxID=103762 RepID=A0A8J5S1I9_ZIZPA|nr:hypothetical protein GUJ93_ZPchr0002g24512 [Zizania palustris]
MINYQISPHTMTTTGAKLPLVRETTENNLSENNLHKVRSVPVMSTQTQIQLCSCTGVEHSALTLKCCPAKNRSLTGKQQQSREKEGYLFRLVGSEL